MILLDLEYSQAGYTPTQFQKDLLPEAYQSRVRVLYDGIPTDFWRRQDVAERTIGKHRFDPTKNR